MASTTEAKLSRWPTASATSSAASSRSRWRRVTDGSEPPPHATDAAAPMVEINVTPLVDGAFLLIIFMVTAPLLVAGVPIDLPESRAGALDQQAEPVQIAIDPVTAPSPSMTLQLQAALANKLAEIAAQPQPEEGRRIYLRADRTLDYGRVMRVMGEPIAPASTASLWSLWGLKTMRMDRSEKVGTEQPCCSTSR